MSVIARCIFCKLTSEGAGSIEHIIPESIGNTKYLLPKGYVCDQCNNYFARKVEGPLLSHTSFRNLRAWYQVPTKKGVMPRLQGFVAGTDINVGVRLGPNGGLDVQPERERDRERIIAMQRSEGQEALALVFSRDFDPPMREMSRLLAKMALEALALRFSSDPELIRLLIDDPHYDRIRNWARRGETSIEWPYHYRPIAPEEALMRHPETDEWVQAGYGFDFFMNRRRETYFAFCLYGHQFVINVGGPSIRGFEEWLDENGEISPLIERVGLKLVRDVESGKEKFRYVGRADLTKGAQFDRRQLERGGHNLA